MSEVPSPQIPIVSGFKKHGEISSIIFKNHRFADSQRLEKTRKSV
jgi:hypothetical protein